MLLPFINNVFSGTIVTVVILISSFIPHTHTANHIAKKDIVKNEKKHFLGDATKVSGSPAEDNDMNDIHIANEQVSQNNENNDGVSTGDDTISENEGDTQSTSTPTPTTISSTDTSSLSSTNPGSPTSNQSPIQSQKTAVTIVAKATITAQGKTIHLLLSYPSTGGNITGTISGDCSGSATGSFNAQSQALSGWGKANCNIGFISVPVSLTFNGIAGSSSVTISYTASAMGKTESGTTTLSF